MNKKSMYLQLICQLESAAAFGTWKFSALQMSVLVFVTVFLQRKTLITYLNKKV